MGRKLIILWIIGLISSYLIKAQTVYPVDNWEGFLEDMADEELDDSAFQQLCEELSYLADHPLDLNTTPAERWRRLPFLSDYQIGRLIDYRERYGRMLSLYELKQVEGMDPRTISRLLPFVYIKDSAVNKQSMAFDNLLKRCHNELLLNYNQCFQQKKGYASPPEEEKGEGRHYLGEPFYHSIRYAFTAGERLQAGFVAEKDAGEPFWNATRKGYDFYSLHLFGKNLTPWLRRLAVGDYRASFGQGLVMSNAFIQSPGMMLIQPDRHWDGFRRHYSTDERNFLRGVAATLGWRRWQLSLFSSFRRMDAAVDSLCFPSLSTGGLHRLPRERAARRTVPVWVYGGHLRYATASLQIGLTALRYSFGKYRMEPDPSPYNLFYFKGSNSFNIGVDYRWRRGAIQLFGETAIGKNGALATLNGLVLTPASYVSLIVLHRFYDRRYQALFANSFARSGAVRNERGIYLGFRIEPLARWSVSGYGDWFRFPWLKREVGMPSVGREYQLRIEYLPSERFSAYLRYSARSRERNGQDVESDSRRILTYQQRRLRYQQVYIPSKAWRLLAVVDGVFASRPAARAGRGMMLSGEVGWRPGSFPLRIDGFAGWFHTDGSDCRVSSRERNLSYAFFHPLFYGHGVRMALSARVELWRRLTLSAKVGHTIYLDRERIGTDLEEIEGAAKTDLYVLARWKF